MVLEGNFEIVQLDDNLARSVRIGDELPFVVNKGLIVCLKAKVGLFIVSPNEMFGIDPNVTCHWLNTIPFICYIAQKRKQKSPEKVEETGKIVQSLLKANFISKLRYI